MSEATGTPAAFDGRFSADIGAQQVARVYAEAFLNVAEKLGQVEELLGEFESFVATVQRNETVRSFLTSGAIGRAAKGEVLDKALTGRASPTLVNFLLVVNHHGRLDVLGPIVHACHEIRNRRLGRLRVQVRSAVPIDAAAQQHLRDELRRKLRLEPMLETQIEPELLGGLVIRVGDMVYDGSVRTRLERLRQQIRSRSLYEIQGRRDHGSHSEGN